MTLELYYDTDAAGRQIITIDPVNPTLGETYTLELFDVQIAFTATASTDANVAAGLKAAIDASVATEWDDVTTSLEDSGDRLVLTYGGASGTTRLWRGDAPAIAQATTITPGAVTTGDVFTLKVNGKTLSYIATESTASNVVDGLLAIVSATDVPEFGDFSATADNGVMTLTASTAGIPFDVSTLSESGDGLVIVTSTTTAQPGTQTQQSFIAADTWGSFRIRYGGAETTALTPASNQAAVQAAVDTMGTMANATVTLTAATTYNAIAIAFDHDGTDNVLTVQRQSDGAVDYTSLDFPAVTSPSTYLRRFNLPDRASHIPDDITGTFRIVYDGQATAEIDVSLRSADLTAAVDAAFSALPNVDGVTITLGVSSTTFDIEFSDAGGAIPAIAMEWVTEPLNSHATVTVDIGGQQAIDSTYSVAVIGDAGTFTLTAASETTAAIAFDASTSTIEAALEALAAIDAATVTGEPGAFVVTFNGALAGTAVTLTGSGTALTGSGTESIAVVTTVASKGPNHWDDDKNWIPEGVPVTGDAVRFEFGSVDCLYGLDQSAVLLSEFHVSLAYTGSVGLPRINNGGFFEYRTLDLTIGATDILIGYGEGGGSGKIQIDTGDDRTTIEVRETGGSSESGIPAFTWRGSDTLNTVNVLSGEFGTALYGDQTSRIDVYTQRGGSASLSNCTLNEIDAPGQTLTAHNCNLGTAPIEL